MLPVKITVKSISGKENSRDKLETISYGQFAQRGGKYYVLYEETTATGMEGTKTTIKWDSESVVVIRSGSYSHRQEYRVNFESSSLYVTPYLTTPIKAITKELKVEGKNNTWTLHVEYEMEVGGEPNGNIILDILIEEDIVSEH